MATPQPAQRVDLRDLYRVIRWFISIRWVATIGVPLTLVTAQFILKIELAYPALYGTAGFLGMINLVYSLLHWRNADRHWTVNHYTALFHVQILVDYLVLLLLVYFSGFLENPFIYFFVFHVLLTSFIFPPAIMWMYVVGLMMLIAAVTSAECLGWVPHFTLSDVSLVSYCSNALPRSAGLCATLAISAYLITSIRLRIEAKGRAIEIELNRYKNLDRIKSNFILQVTHELRGPIAAVSGYHDMILRGITGEIGDKTASSLQKAERRTTNLLTIIDEMIDYAYMRSESESRYRWTEIQVDRSLTEMVDKHLTHAQGRRISIQVDCEPGLTIQSNRDLFDITLGNLINNAIKYSPADTTITVSAHRDGEDIKLQVSDQGYGIEADQLEQIFEEFYRTRHARELERDGTGLGLPIVKRAVESLGGRIRVYSEVNRGTRFDIWLPRDEQHQDSVEERDIETHSHH